MLLAYHVTCYEKGLLTIMFTLLHINLKTCGQQGTPLKSLSPVDQTRNNVIQQVNHCPVDIVVCPALKQLSP